MVWGGDDGGRAACKLGTSAWGSLETGIRERKEKRQPAERERRKFWHLSRSGMDSLQFGDRVMEMKRNLGLPMRCVCSTEQRAAGR